jgi:hypothetical protein
VLFRSSYTLSDGRQPECKECACARRRDRYFDESIKRCGPERAKQLAEIRSKKKEVKEGHKLCARCLEIKKLGQFCADKKVSDGHGSYCKPCTADWTKEWRSSSPTRRLALALNTSKSVAKKKGLIHTLTLAELVNLWNSQNGKCYYSGVQMRYDGGGEPESVSVDRVDSSKGYMKNNVVLCCVYVNRMKNDRSVDTLTYWCGAVLAHLNRAALSTEEMTQ